MNVSGGPNEGISMRALEEGIGIGNGEREERKKRAGSDGV
jgi:hypothetical protein